MIFHARTAEVRASIAAVLEENQGMPAVPLADLVFDAFRDSIEAVIRQQTALNEKAGYLD